VKRFLLLLALFARLSLAETPSGYSSDPFQGLEVCADTLQLLSERVANNKFAYRRNLMEYRSTFGSEFWLTLVRLAPEEQWLDAGSGAGIATAEYQVARLLSDPLQSLPLFPLPTAFPAKRAKTLGVVVKLPQAAAEFRAKVKEAGLEDRYRGLEGRKIEDIPASELGHAKLITDFFGPVSYSAELDRVLNKYLEVGHPDAEIYIKFNPGKFVIATKSGERLTLDRYLERALKGHKVTVVDSVLQSVVRIRLRPDGVKTVPPLQLQEVLGDGLPSFFYSEK